MAWAAMGELDLETASKRATDRVREISGADYAAISLTDPSDPGRLTLLWASGLGDARPECGARIPRQGIAAMVLDSGRPVITEDLTTDPRLDRTSDRWGHLSVIGLAMFMPLTADNEVVGTLLIGWRRWSSYPCPTAREVDLVQTFANQLALTLQRLRTQEKERRGQRWFEAATQIAQLVVGGVDRDETMRLVVRQLREISRADIASITLADQNDPDSMDVVAFEGIDGAEVPPNTRIRREGIRAHVLADGRRVLSDGYPHLKDRRPPPGWAESLSHLGLGMQVPLFADGRARGTLFAGWHRRSPHAYAARAEAAQVQTFADLAALALARRGHGLTGWTTFQSSEGSAALMNLLVASMTERNQAWREADVACAQLAEVITRLDRAKSIGLDNLRALSTRHGCRRDHL
ncbi:GAF domain-containing protein [Actinopolymorpha pittospori]